LGEELLSGCEVLRTYRSIGCASPTPADARRQTVRPNREPPRYHLFMVNVS
jgi:hypothetical protein